MEFKDLGIIVKPGVTRGATTCPRCSHLRKKKTDPCLTYNNEPGNRWFKCWNDFYMGNLDKMERYDKVRANSGMPDNMQVERHFAQKFTRYFRARGLSPRTLTTEMVYETTKGVVGFPFYEEHTQVNAKFFNQNATDENGELKWWQLKKEYGTKSCFWGLQNLVINKDPLRPEPNIITITEGEWDKLTYNECALKNILSVPMGAPSPDAKNFTHEFNYVKDPYFQKEVLPFVDTFILSVDDDPGGHVLMTQLAILLGKYRCKRIAYPKGYKDINEVLAGNKKKQLEALGKSKVLELHEQAPGLPISGIIKLSDLKHDLMHYQKHGLTPGLKTGIPELDHIFTSKRKHMTVITGVPGMGKSIWLRWYLLKLVKENPEIKISLFTPEQRPMIREYIKLSELMQHKHYQEGLPTSMSEEERSIALNYLEHHFTIVAPDKSNYEDFDGSIKVVDLGKLESICKYIAYLKKTKNIFGYVIDSYGKLDNDPGHLSETKFIKKQLNYLADFNEYHDLHGWLVAHPTKLQKDKNGNYIMPGLYDISGSSAWNEMIDIGLVIHRYKFQEILQSELTSEELQMQIDDPSAFDDLKYKARDSTLTYMKAEKIRFEEIGTEGILRFNFLPFNDFEVAKVDKGYHERTKKQNESQEDTAAVEPWLPFVDGDDDDLPF